MARSGQGAGRPPPANIAVGSSRSAAQPGDSSFDAQVALGLVGLGVVGHVLRSRRLYEKVAVAAIVVGALRGIGHDNRVSTMARLQAWNKREVQRLERQAQREIQRLERKAQQEVQRLERKAQRQGRAVKGSARMARSGPPRGPAEAGPQN
jgi:hypothetical protein